MAILRKDEAFPKRPVIIVLYGTPGVGKTSLANTANNPLLLDCDRGSDRAANRVDTIVAKSWDDVLKDEGEMNSYSTISIDTAKAVLDDYLINHVVKNDYKLKSNKLRMYGEIGDEFKAFINRRRESNADIVIIAHAKEEKDGDVIKVSPDVTGQSKDLILRIADQVGFVTTINNKRVISFDPTDKAIGKNVARIPATEIPDETKPEFATFMASIIERVKESLQKQSEEQIATLKKNEEILYSISILEQPENADAILTEIFTLKKHQQAGLKAALNEKVTSLGFVYNKATKKFENVPTPDNAN